VREGKVTLPLLLALKRCTPAERDRIEKVLKSVARLAEGGADAGDADAPDLDPVLELVERHRGVVDTVRRAREHKERAATAVAAFPDGEARRALLAAAEFAVSRDC
jgi:octaprenyl-diphosphate synthase